MKKKCIIFLILNLSGPNTDYSSLELVAGILLYPIFLKKSGTETALYSFSYITPVNQVP